MQNTMLFGLRRIELVNCSFDDSICSFKHGLIIRLRCSDGGRIRNGREFLLTQTDVTVYLTRKLSHYAPVIKG